jgi:hypothetical protein
MTPPNGRSRYLHYLSVASGFSSFELEGLLLISRSLLHVRIDVVCEQYFGHLKQALAISQAQFDVPQLYSNRIRVSYDAFLSPK